MWQPNRYIRPNTYLPGLLSVTNYWEQGVCVGGGGGLQNHIGGGK